jgi:uncharacterized damage-inducible protein DinB
MSRNVELVFSLDVSRKMLHMFVDDLTPDERLHRSCAGANCIDWLVGHLVVVERMFHQRIGATSPPIPEGFDKKFARDESAPKQADYGDTSNLMELFDEQRDATIEKVRTLTADDLAKPLQHPRFSNVGEAIAFCSLHVAMHAGQMSMIRRSLGKPPVI